MADGTGFRPVRGNWEIREFTQLSTATFRQWAPLELNGARTVIEATSAASTILGVALHASVDSLPAGKVLVAMPRDNSAVARAKIETDVAASLISIGQNYNIEKSGNNLRVDVDSQASALVQIVGTVDSATSEIDVVFLKSLLVLPSATSAAPV